MIMRAIEPCATWEETRELLSELAIAVNRIDCRQAMAILEKAVREYRSSPVIHDLVYGQRRQGSAAAAVSTDPKVTVLPTHRAAKQAPGEAQGPA
jgi:hypothetical protein